MCYGQDLIFFFRSGLIIAVDFNIVKKNVKMWLSEERRRNRQSGVMAVTLSLLPWLQARERREGDYCDVLCLCVMSVLSHRDFPFLPNSTLSPLPISQHLPISTQ